METVDNDDGTTTQSGKGFIGRLFRQCDPDPKGSVNKTWSFTTLIIIVFFIIAISEVVSLESNGASEPLIVAAVWTAIIQVIMLVGGTFIIKRFSTPFSVGVLLGLVIFVAQQHLMLSVTFWHTQFGSMAHNMLFSNFSFTLFVVYSFFGVILNNYREDIFVAAIDAPGLRGISMSTTGNQIGAEENDEDVDVDTDTDA